MIKETVGMQSKDICWCLHGNLFIRLIIAGCNIQYYLIILYTNIQVPYNAKEYITGLQTLLSQIYDQAFPSSE